MRKIIYMAAVLILCASPAWADASAATDLFDNASIDNPPWVYAADYMGVGSVTEAGGYLILDPPSSGLSLLAAVQDGTLSAPFDLRLSAEFPNGLGNNTLDFYVAEDWTADPAISVRISLNADNISRKDVVVGDSGYGAVDTAAAGCEQIYLRITCDAGGTLACFYKLTPGDEWTTLAEPTPSLTSTNVVDIMLVYAQEVAGGQDVELDWIVDGAAYDWPVATMASSIIFLD